MLGECSVTWWRSAVFYHIYPRSFADGNGDGIGDLFGITARVDYLNDGSAASLQVDALWLSPFFPSPQIDFGYDVSDFTAVDPVYGTLADFDRLLDAAHRRGMHVILDLILNHSSTKHPWFLEAQGDRFSPRRSWYIWADPAPGGGPPNNWLSSFPAVGSAWTLDERSGQYFLTTFSPAQPDLNWRNPELRHAMHDVMRFWLSRGVDGFRLDVARERERRVPRPDGNGKIEGADHAAHAERVPSLRHAMVRALGGDRQPIEPAREADGELADVDHLLNFAAAFRQDLARLYCHQPAKNLLCCAQLLAQEADQLAAPRRRHAAPGEERRVRASNLYCRAGGLSSTP